MKRVTALHLAAPTGPAVPAVLFPADDQFLLPGRHEALFSFYRDVWPAPGEPLLPGIDAADVEQPGLVYVQGGSGSGRPNRGEG